MHAAVRQSGWSVPEALTALRAAQKPPQGTPAYSRFVNRPLGRHLAAWAVRLGLSPNTVSGLSALCSFTAILMIACTGPSFATAVVVALLLVIGYALDSADGQVARLTRAGSPFGEWLDHMIDCAKVTALHLAVAVHLYRFTDLSATWLLVPLAYCLVANVLFFGMILTDQLRRATGVIRSSSGGSLSVIRSLAILPSDFGALCLVFLTLAWSSVFVSVYGLMLLGSALLLGAAVIRWSGELRGLREVSAA